MSTCSTPSSIAIRPCSTRFPQAPPPQAELVERAVAAGKAQNLDFTVAEADAFIARQAASEAEGELSDVQLEGVAGGKKGRGISLSKLIDVNDEH